MIASQKICDAKVEMSSCGIGPANEAPLRIRTGSERHREPEQPGRLGERKAEKGKGLHLPCAAGLRAAR